MNTLFILMFCASMVAILVFGCMIVVKKVKKQSTKGMVQKLLISILVWCGSLVGFDATSPDIVAPESLELAIIGEQEAYDLNSAICVEIKATPENADLSSLEYTADSEAVTFENHYILTGNEAGTYQVYVSAGEVTSNTLSVTVADKAALAEAEMAEAVRSAREEALLEAEQLAASGDAELEEAGQKIEELESKLEAAEASVKELEEQLAEEQAARESAEMASEEAAVKLEEESAARKAAEQEVKDVKKELASAQKSTTVKTAGASGSSGSTSSTASSSTTASSAGVSNAAAASSFTAANSTAAETNAASSQQQEVSAASGTQQEVTYVLNTNTKKFHKPSCSSVDTIKAKNYATSNGTREEVIAQGYDPCKRCNP